MVALYCYSTGPDLVGIRSMLYENPLTGLSSVISQPINTLT